MPNYLGTPGGRSLRALREQVGKPQLTIEVDADLGSGYLQRVESGKVMQPTRKTLERILTALHARYSEQREVLELFGYTVAAPLPTEEEIAWACAICATELHGVIFPAYVLDCGHRLLAWNRYIPRIIGVPAVGPGITNPARLCALNLWFDPRYGLSARVKNPDIFFPALVRALRHEIQSFRHEEWCSALMARLLRELPLLRQYWAAGEEATGSAVAARPAVPLHIDVPPIGPLQFRTSAEHFTRDARFRIVYYLPADPPTMHHCAIWADLPEPVA